MATFHMYYGMFLLLLVIITTIIEMARSNGAPRPLRGATIGLLDLQVIFGIITWIIEKPAPSFIWHPLFMIVAIVIAHVFTGAKKSHKTRIIGWVVAAIILILGASLFHG